MKPLRILAPSLELREEVDHCLSLFLSVMNLRPKAPRRAPHKQVPIFNGRRRMG
jgi:hypothetical protein